MTPSKRCGVAVAILFALFLLTVAVLLLVATGITLTLKEKNDYIEFTEDEQFLISDQDFRKYVSIFGDVIRFRTVSAAPGEYDTDQLRNLNQYLEKTFPRLFNSSFIDVETVNNYSLLFTIKGSDSSLSPFLLASHFDVVPVAPERWSRDPFLGRVVSDPDSSEDCIWGRGAIDDKAGVVGILSALDILISSDWIPKRGFYVAFGHDEEVFGLDGAAHIGRLLSERNVTLEFLLDEGMPLVQGLMQGIDSPVALIGVTEKGRMDVRLTAEGSGGHSSIPPQQQAVEKLSAALTRLYQNPHPSMFGLGPEKDMLEYLAPSVDWPYKFLFANIWLFRPLISFAMSRKSQSDALLRTTTAVTIVKAGVKSNVVPAVASAVVNHRIHPSQSLSEVLAHDAAAIADDSVKVEMIDGVKPHPVSPYGPDSIPYKIIAGAVKHVYPKAVTAPAVTVGNTDTRHYLHLTSHIFRFLPLLLNQNAVATIHGDNERLTLSNFRSAIMFYRTIILSSERSNTKSLTFGSHDGEL